MTGEGTDKTFELLRELPTEVSLETVGQLVATFPLLPAAASWTNYINLNSIAMTSAGTLIIAGTAYFLSPAAPEPVAEVPAPIIEEMVEASVEMDAVVWPGPAKKDPPKRASSKVAVVSVPEPVPVPAPEPVKLPLAKVTPPVAPEPAPSPAAVAAAPKHGSSDGVVYDVKDFTSVSVQGGLDVMVEQGPFAVSADEEDADEFVEVIVEGKTLVIASKDRKGWKKGGCENLPHVRVSMPTVEGLILNGSGDIHVDDFTDLSKMGLILNGSGDVHFTKFSGLRELNIHLAGSGDIHGEEVEVSGPTSVQLEGSGDISVHGRSEDLQVQLVGSGDVDASELFVNSCSVSVIGSGDVVANCRGNFSSSVTGSGDVYNTGNAGVRVRGEGSDSY